MRARFSDPEGPKAWRAAPYALPALAFSLAVLGPLEGAASMTMAFAAIALFNVIGLVSLRQRRARSAEITCGPGYIDIRRAGTRNQRIRAADISGGTTARTSRGICLTLQHRRREQPINLELDGDAEIEKVRRALGIGHGGFGVIAWRTEVDSFQRTAWAGRAVAAAWALLVIAATIAGSTQAGAAVAVATGMFGVIGAILGFGALWSPIGQPSVLMAADGLRVRTPTGWFALPYDALKGVHDGKHLSFSVPEPFRSVVVARSTPILGGPSKDDRRVMVAQLEAAGQRARGMGRHKDDVSGRVEVLRRNGESPREWLVRLDMAGQMLSAGPGYRGHALDTEDLWAVLEDPDADPELRAAAARVLRHSSAPETRIRIDAAVAAVRDASTNRRLRISLRDDVDGASQELAYLDATDAQARSRSRMAIDPRAGMRPSAHGRSMHGR